LVGKLLLHAFWLLKPPRKLKEKNTKGQKNYLHVNAKMSKTIEDRNWAK